MRYIEISYTSGEPGVAPFVRGLRVPSDATAEDIYELSRRAFGAEADSFKRQVMVAGLRFFRWSRRGPWLPTGPAGDIALPMGWGSPCAHPLFPNASLSDDIRWMRAPLRR